MTLVLPKAEREAVVSHARSGAPEEVCGILGGARDEARATVADVRRTTNVAPDPTTTYEVDPEEQLAAMEAIEAAGRAVVGFYHSHPRGPAGPSATDRARASWPGYVYVIVSLAGGKPEVGAWRWTGEAFEREALRIE